MLLKRPLRALTAWAERSVSPGFIACLWGRGTLTEHIDRENLQTSKSIHDHRVILKLQSDVPDIAVALLGVGLLSVGERSQHHIRAEQPGLARHGQDNLLEAASDHVLAAELAANGKAHGPPRRLFNKRLERDLELVDPLCRVGLQEVGEVVLARDPDDEEQLLGAFQGAGVDVVFEFVVEDTEDDCEAFVCVLGEDEDVRGVALVGGSEAEQITAQHSSELRRGHRKRVRVDAESFAPVALIDDERQVGVVVHDDRFLGSHGSDVEGRDRYIWLTGKWMGEEGIRDAERKRA